MNENQGKCRLKYALVLAAVGMWLWLGVGSAGAASSYSVTDDYSLTCSTGNCGTQGVTGGTASVKLLGRINNAT